MNDPREINTGSGVYSDGTGSQFEINIIADDDGAPLITIRPEGALFRVEAAEWQDLNATIMEAIDAFSKLQTRSKS